ncbi:MAG: hypothetical protein RL414_360 [Actinomycetota bacterium]|jgi:N utilization substance protein A
MAVDYEGLQALAAERKIPIEQLINYVENRVAEAYAEFPDAKPKGRCVYNRLAGEFVIHVPVYAEDGTWLETVVDNPEGFAAIAESVARKSLKEKIREVADNEVISEFSASVGDVISGVVQQGRDESVIYVYLGGRTEGKIPLNEQVKGETFKHGDRIKAFVVKVEKGLKGPEITLSRTHPHLVRALFALEVPEIKDRIVEVMGVSREPGARSKISVRSHRGGVSPKGALIGPNGARSRAVSDELFGEKIDIVDWSEDPAKYVANALAPARVTSVQLVDAETKSVKVVVPDFQLSLAIGKDGQNARLAARLTGCRIDIHPDNPVERIEKPKPVQDDAPEGDLPSELPAEG